MKHLFVTLLALILGIFVGFGMSYTIRQPETAPDIRTDGGPATAVGPGEPVVVFSPSGSFSDEEKEILTRTLIQPLSIYNQTSDLPLLSIMIERANANAGQVTVAAIHESGSFTSFVHIIGEDWIPDCFFSDCSGIPESFRTLYPDLYQKALKQN